MQLTFRSMPPTSETLEEARGTDVCTSVIGVEVGGGGGAELPLFALRKSSNGGMKVAAKRSRQRVGSFL